MKRRESWFVLGAGWFTCVLTWAQEEETMPLFYSPGALAKVIENGATVPAAGTNNRSISRTAVGLVARGGAAR